MAIGRQVRPIGTLTRRQAEVAALVAAGLTNRQIGERLVISERTVDAHVWAIMSSLDVKSRSEIAHHMGMQAVLTTMLQIKSPPPSPALVWWSPVPDNG